MKQNFQYNDSNSKNWWYRQLSTRHQKNNWFSEFYFVQRAQLKRISSADWHVTNSDWSFIEPSLVDASSLFGPWWVSNSAPSSWTPSTGRWCTRWSQGTSKDTRWLDHHIRVKMHFQIRTCHWWSHGCISSLCQLQSSVSFRLLTLQHLSQELQLQCHLGSFAPDFNV
jgi:hypothetical protein